MFLCRHASTLRFIHFHNCHIEGDQLALAKWAGKTLNPQGIDITYSEGVRFPNNDDFHWDDRFETPDVEFDTALTPKHLDTWLDGRPNLGFPNLV